MSEESKPRASCFPISLKSKKNMAICTDPALEMVLMSLMIADLVDSQYITYSAQTTQRMTYVRMLLPAPAANIKVC